MGEKSGQAGKVANLVKPGVDDQPATANPRDGLLI
jgi:hypothetical protein